MSYTGRFTIDDAGLLLTVAIPNEEGTVRSLVVAFTFEQLGRSLDPRILVHGVIARRIVDATRSLDEED